MTKKIAPPSFLLALLAIYGLPSCQRVDKGQSEKKGLSQQEEQVESLQENELIWAGLSGNPPRFIDFGEEKGLGYIEVQTKLIRKALVEAGFKLRYEYFSSARIAHEFSRKSPICFYPIEWKNPERTFATAPDRIYSIALDFTGEETRSIVIRKGEEARFSRYLDSKGNLVLKELLQDVTLKTLLPKTEGLGPEFNPVYRYLSDGSIEITKPYRKHVETRVLRDNNQLVQMLEGGRFDYLLDTFIIADDYKAIRSGKTPFTSLAYETGSIQSITDPEITLTSVTCSLHDTVKRAMPVINAAIRDFRGPVWSYRTAKTRDQFEPGVAKGYYSSLSSRFSHEIASAAADFWYPMQLKHFPDLTRFVLTAQEEAKAKVLASSTPQEVLPEFKPIQKASWVLLRPGPSAIWILPKSDAIDLAISRKSSFLQNSSWLQGTHCSKDYLNAWTPDQIEFLQHPVDPTKDHEGSFEEILAQIRSHHPNGQDITSFSILARGLTADQIQQALSRTQQDSLTQLDLVSVSAEALKEVLPKVPLSLDRLNLWGSDLGNERLAPILRKFRKLKHLKLSCAAMHPTDYFESLFALPSQMVSISVGETVVPWTKERAAEFGRKSFPELETFDLGNSYIDDRHCQILGILPPGLKELKLNGTLLTSECLERVFRRDFPKLRVLELAMARFSTQAKRMLRLPPSVESLDLSDSIREGVFEHIQLPTRLKSLSIKGAGVEPDEFRQIARHLSSKVESLNLSDAPRLNFTLLKALEDAGVTEVEDLRLANLNLSLPPEERQKQFGGVVEALQSLKVSRLEIQNARLSNFLLSQISHNWAAWLKEVNLSQNFISSGALISFLKVSPQLEALDLSDLPEVNAQLLANDLPKNLLTLSIENNGLSDTDLESLVPKLPRKLAKLNLSGSLFGSRGAKVLGRSLGQDTPRLVDLHLVSSLPEAAWDSILLHLPSDLKTLTFGPALLGARSTSLILKNLPTHLASLHTERVRLTAAHPFEVIRQLPPGLGRFSMGKGSALDGINDSAPPDPSLSKTQWPGALRLLTLTASDWSRNSLQAIFRALPPVSRCDVGIANSKTTAAELRELVAHAKGQLPLVDVSSATISPPMIHELNQLRPQFLSLNNIKLESCRLSDLRSAALQNLKVLGLNGAKASNQDLIALVKRLPPHMYVLSLSGTRLDYSDVDPLIAALPRGLFRLNVAGTQIGPKGVKKFKDYAKRIEEKTGFRPLVVTQ